MKNKLSGMKRSPAQDSILCRYQAGSTRNRSLLRRIQPIVVWLLAAVLIGLGGCEKEKFTELDDISEYRLNNVDARFFDYFHSTTNALSHDEVTFRNETTDSLTLKMIRHLQGVNAQTPFVDQVIDRFGYPAWSRAVTLTDSSSMGRLVVVPLVKENHDSTMAVMISAVFNEQWIDFFFPRASIDAHLSGSLSINADELHQLRFAASTFIQFDRLLFSKESHRFTNWLKPARRSSQSPVSDIEFRCTYVLQFEHCFLLGAATPLRAPISKGSKYEEAQTEARTKLFTVPVCQIMTVIVPCSGGGGGAFSGPPGSHIPGWTSGSGSTGGSNQGASFVAQLTSICAGINGNNGEIAGTGELNSEQAAFCEAFSMIQSSFPIGGELLQWLYQYGNSNLYNQITTYLSSQPDALGLRALQSYLAYLRDGKNFSFNSFIALFRLVHGQLVPQLQLTEDEAEYLLVGDNGALANEIREFLQEAQATQNQEEIEAGNIAANLLIDLHMADRENGPVDQTYLDILSNYTEHIDEELLEDCCTGSIINDAVRSAILATEEAIFLKQAHPEWSDNKIRWKAFQSVITGQVHTALDIIGLIPALGEVADLVNGVLYTVQGDGVNAALSYGAAIPFVGWVSTGAKYATILYKVGNKTYRMKNYIDAAGKITFSHSGKLRAILGMGPAASDLRQAHHIIPEALWDNPLVQKAAKSGDGSKVFHMNGPHNGVPVPNTRHNGSHPAYSQKIEDELIRWDLAFPNATPDQAAQRLRQWQQALKNQIGNSTQHINDIIPPQIPPL